MRITAPVESWRQVRQAVCSVPASFVTHQLYQLLLDGFRLVWWFVAF
jgi:hypothetical protein